MTSKLHVFGRCVVDPATREVRLDGLVQVVAPKVFSMLLHLIENRHRVVPKDELLTQFWPAAGASQSAVARSVMKARAAIGDDGAEPAFIRTVHRVGYRFMAEPDQADETSAVEGSASQQPAQAALRLALLPFDNRTGDSHLAWIDLGLKSLVRHAFAADPRVVVLQTADTLRVIESLGAYAHAGSQAQAIERTLGAECVLHCVVTKEDAVYRLDYRSFGTRAQNLRGHVSAEEPTQLGQQLADAIEAVISRGVAPPQPPLHFKDPLANLAFARALDAQQREQGAMAARLYELVLELEPDHLRLQLMAVRSITTVDPAKAVTIARRLLHAVAGGKDRADPVLHAAAEEALGMALALTHPIEEGRQLLASALARVQGLAPDADVARVHYSSAVIAERIGDDTGALALWEPAVRVARTMKDERQLGLCLNNMGLVCLRQGRLDEARVSIEESLRLARRQGRLVVLAHVLGSMADVHAAQGRLDLALARCDEASEAMPRCLADPTLASMIFYTTQVYADARAVSRIDRLLDIARARPTDADRSPQAPLVAAEGLRAACIGDRAHAVDRLCVAIDLARSGWDDQLLHEFLPWLAACQLKDGRSHDAAATAERIRGLWAFASQPTLQAVAARVQAGADHALGRREAARASLARAIGSMVPGRHAALARLDAAWLALEDGENDAGDALLAGLDTWLAYHPIGRAVEARRLHMRGQREAACATQQACIDMQRDVAPAAWLVAARQAYEQAPRPGRIAALERLPSFM